MVHWFVCRVHVPGGQTVGRFPRTAMWGFTHVHGLCDDHTRHRDEGQRYILLLSIDHRKETQDGWECEVCGAHFTQHIMQHNAIPPYINSVHGCSGLSCMAIHVHAEFVHARGTPVQLSLPGVDTVDGHFFLFGFMIEAFSSFHD